MGLRLFVAVSLDDATRAALDAALRSAREMSPPGVRWVAREGWHFTLQFLGDTREAQVVPLTDALSRVAAHHRPFDVVLAGTGAFPRAEHARVVWVGATQGELAMAALAADVVRETSALGFLPEAREFQPHLTVARLKRAARVDRVLQAMRMAPVTHRVREIVLYRSHRSQSGARYEALAQAPLAT